MCLGLGLLEKITGQAAARKSAQKTAKLQAEQSRLAASANQNQLETNIAQQAQSRKAAELLGVPIESTDVAVGDASMTDADPVTGRKRATRSQFQMPATSGLVIP